MSYGLPITVPNALQQKCFEVKDSVTNFSVGDNLIEKGKILVWRDKETNFFWTTDNSGRFVLYRYQNGVENARIYFTFNFRPTAVVNDALYFPGSENYPGVAVAVSDCGSGDRGNHFIAYFSLKTCQLLKCFHVTHPITCMYNVFDGTTSADKFLQLVNQFHTGWKDMLLVGCNGGHAYLLNLEVVELHKSYNESESQNAKAKLDNQDGNYSDDDEKNAKNAQNKNEKVNEGVVTPVRAKRTVPLTKLFHGEQMFVFRSDEGKTICLEKDRVFVSALHYLEKCKLVLIGFNFGGILSISLATSKISITHMVDGIVKHFAVQEPEEDPRPLLYYWTCIKTPAKGTYVILSSINFPKDEAATKDPSEYTFLEPVMVPLMKWQPDNCSEMVSMRTLVVDHRMTTPFLALKELEHHEDTGDICNVSKNSSINDVNKHRCDTSLMLIVWQQKLKDSDRIRIHGSLFDLNSFYAKRLNPRVAPDNTVAKQIPFFSRFTSDTLHSSLVVDIFAESVFRFPAPAFLKDSIDQLFYPSTFYITFNHLSCDRISQFKVQPIQIQLVSNLTENVEKHFEHPTEPSRWIFAIGLANSAPALNNINEERACMLRVLLHIFLPGVMRLISLSAGNIENLKFIQRWIWKEIELTKTKFDDLSAPLFSNSSVELSPDARGYIHHARAFFRRACLVLEALDAHAEAFNDLEWKKSITLQYRAARQVEIFSLGIAFGLFYKLLPLNGKYLVIHKKCMTEIWRKFANATNKGKHLKIYKLVDEMIAFTPEESVWKGLKADKWFPPNDFFEFLPVLLLMEISDTAKLNLLGYYCIEFERAVDTVDMEKGGEFSALKKLFEKCCSFFMQDEYSVELQNQIHKMWMDDKSLTDCDSSLTKATTPTDSLASSTQNGFAKGEDKLKWLPLNTFEEVKHAKSEYLKLEYGVHKFNWSVIEKRRFDLIIETLPCSEIEPEFVFKCRQKCAEVKERFPWIFSKVEPFSTEIIEKFRENLALEVLEQRENVVHIGTRKRTHSQQKPIYLSVRHAKKHDVSIDDKKRPISLLNVKRRRAAATALLNSALIKEEGEDTAHVKPVGNEFNSDEEAEKALFEELPLTIATPAKRQRLMLFSVSTPKSVSTQKKTNLSTNFETCQPDIYGLRSELSSNLIKSRFGVGMTPRLGKKNEEEKEDRRLITLPRRRQLQSPQAVDSPTVSGFTKGDIRSKDWDRISKVMQTPLSLKKRIDSSSRIPIRFQPDLASLARNPVFSNADKESIVEKPSNSTEFTFLSVNISPTKRQNNEMPPPTPLSILKSNKKSRLPSEARPRLRFSAMLQTTEQIPSRAEKQYEEAKDNSFTTFGALTESSSSPSIFRDSPYQESLNTVVSSLSQHSSAAQLLPPNFEEQNENDVSNDWSESNENKMNVEDYVEKHVNKDKKIEEIVKPYTVLEQEYLHTIIPETDVKIFSEGKDFLKEVPEEDQIVSAKCPSPSLAEEDDAQRLNNEQLNKMADKNDEASDEITSINVIFKPPQEQKDDTLVPTKSVDDIPEHYKAIESSSTIVIKKRWLHDQKLPSLNTIVSYTELEPQPILNEEIPSKQKSIDSSSIVLRSRTPRKEKSPTPNRILDKPAAIEEKRNLRKRKSPSVSEDKRKLKDRKSPTPSAIEKRRLRDQNSMTPSEKALEKKAPRSAAKQGATRELSVEETSEIAGEDCSKWVAANLRRSTRTKSPRKIFDEVKKVKE